MLTSLPAHPEGRLLGGYRLVSRLSAGALGEVYLAEQLSLDNRRVAIKVVPTRTALADEAEASVAGVRFMREAQVLASFAHRHIVTVHDAGATDDVLYLVMQYVPDGSLADAIRGKGRTSLALPAPPALAVALVRQVAAALQYTHEHGIVHRDVKASNVLVQVHPDGRWHLLLADFGIARDLRATADLQDVMGTLAYMAPEQFDGRYARASDQYALGVLTYLLLAGRTPFQGSGLELMHAHLSATVPDLRQLNPSVPSALVDAVARALAKDPAARWPSVAAFSAALEEGLNEVPSLAGDGSPGRAGLFAAGVPLLAAGALRPVRDAPASLAGAATAPASRGGPAGTRALAPATQQAGVVPARPAPVGLRRVRQRPRLALALSATLLLAALVVVAPRVLFSSGLAGGANQVTPPGHRPHLVPKHVGTAGGSLAPGARPTPIPTQGRPATPLPSPTLAPTATPTPPPTATPSPQPTPTPAATATPTPVATPIATPIATPAAGTPSSGAAPASVA